MAQFEQAPIVTISGVVANKGRGGSFQVDNGELWNYSFTFVVWRVEHEDVQTTRLNVTALIPREEIERFCGAYGRFYSNILVQIKARLIENEHGFKQALYVEWVGPAHDDSELYAMEQELSAPVVFESPMLPTFQLADHAWHGVIELKSWADFCISNCKPRTTFGISIGTEGPPLIKLGYKGVPPSPEQIAACSYLIDNDQRVRDAVLQAAFDNYMAWQENYGSDPEYMPNVTELKQFKSLLMLWDVSIGGTSKDGFAYVYFSLIPEWDPEHGLAAVLYKDQVIAIGDHDTVNDVVLQDAEEE